MLKTGCSVLSRCTFMSRIIDGLLKKREVVLMILRGNLIFVIKETSFLGEDR